MPSRSAGLAGARLTPARSAGRLAAALRAACLAIVIAGPAFAGGLTMLAHAPAEPQPHPPLIVLLHGADADERDMITMWPQLPAQLVVVSPRAPYADPGGGWRWYRKDHREADIAASRKVVDLIVAEAVKRFDADPKRVFIGGFSQGAVMALEVALHDPSRYRGAAALSGLLDASATAGRAPGGAAPDIFLGHGTADARIPFAAATAAREKLQRLGVPLEFHAYAGMGHETGAAEMEDFAAWLAARVAP